MRLLPYLIIFASFFCSAQEVPPFRFHGIKIFVYDLEKAEAFYINVAGFRIKSKSNDELELITNTWPIYLVKTSGSVSSMYPKRARTGLTLQAYKLLPTIDGLRQKEVDFYDTLLARNGVGISIPFKDPSGNVLSLMEVQVREIPEFEGLMIYNTGVTVNSIENAFAFYGNILGFEEWSRNYLPDALPLKHKDGSFAFMLHQKGGLARASIDHGNHPHISLIFEVKNLSETTSFLTKNNISFDRIRDRIIMKDLEGNSIEIQTSGD